jgi:hypothetical protein
MASQYLSIKNLSEFFQQSSKWCYQMLNKGEIPGAFKVGGTWFIDRETLQDGLKAKIGRSAKKGSANLDDRHSLL